MKEGDIILVPLPQADGQTKLRPAIILKIIPPFGDFLVCGVSTQLRQQVAGFDEIIKKNDPDFAITGLRQESLIRSGFLAVFARGQVAGSIGEISAQRKQRLLKKLSDFLLSNKKAS